MAGSAKVSQYVESMNRFFGFLHFSNPECRKLRLAENLLCSLQLKGVRKKVVKSFAKICKKALRFEMNHAATSDISPRF
jgi:hypothetical protein